MAHLNVYLSKERTRWLRSGLEAIARRENRSLSYVVEEALVNFIKQAGRYVPKQVRQDHRRRLAS